MVQVFEPLRDVREHRPRIGGDRIRQSVVQNRHQTRARVFGIDVDGTRAQRTERDFRGSKPGPPVYYEAARFQ